MGIFDGIGDMISDVLGSLPTQRQPNRVVTTFGYPGGSFVSINNGFGGPVSLGPGDEWVAEVETFESTYPHWWEIGMNFRNNHYYNDGDELSGSTDGFSYISWSILVNGESVGGGGPNGYVHTVFIPENSTVEIVVSGASIPELRWAEFSPNGYAVKVRV